MSVKGWKLIEKTKPGQRRIVKYTYENYPLYDIISFLMVVGLLFTILCLGALIGLGFVDPTGVLFLSEKHMITVAAFAGVALMLPCALISCQLVTREEYVPDEESGAKAQ